MKKILIKIFLTFSFKFGLFSSPSTSLVSLKLNWVLEKNKNKKMRKYNPPSHWEDDRQSNKVGSKYFTFLNIVKPVPVIPEKDSKTESIKINW